MNLLHTIFSCGLIHKCSGHCVVNVSILGEGGKLKILLHVHWKTFSFLEFPSQPASGNCDVVMVVKFQLYRIKGLVMVRGGLCLVSCITPRLIFTLLSCQFTWRAHHTPLHSLTVKMEKKSKTVCPSQGSRELTFMCKQLQKCTHTWWKTKTWLDMKVSFAACSSC